MKNLAWNIYLNCGGRPVIHAQNAIALLIPGAQAEID
jgi:hypothetical protein